MKYSLKNQYKNLLNEEIASIKSKKTNYKEELYDIRFDSQGEIASGKKVELSAENDFRLKICSLFTSEPSNKVMDFIKKIERISSVTGKKHGITIRMYIGNMTLQQIVNRLNDYYKETIFWSPKARIGRGEVSTNIAFYTLTPGIEGYQHAAHKEPDFVALKKPDDFSDVAKYSIKSFTKANILASKDTSTAGGAQTGTNFSAEIEEVLTRISSEVFNKVPYTTVFSTSFDPIKELNTKTYTTKSFENVIMYFISKLNKPEKLTKLNKLRDLILELRDAIVVEHEAEGIIGIDNTNTFIGINPGEGRTELGITNFTGTRIGFQHLKSAPGTTTFLKVVDKLINEVESNEHLEDEEVNVNESDSSSIQNSSYKPQGKVLKEVYSYLFKKKVINEGGLAGHMMHPYEALDMTPNQIINKVKEYGVPQSIIEKVDGQNLFFTVEKDGTLMFARNKKDMSHNDLIVKFTGHPAELPFVEGGNAIKSGVDQWLSSAGGFAENEILEIFHPTGEIKSFINFEIMHPEKANQIKYDEKYIVFHSIVDFTEGREKVYSSNKSQRLNKLIKLMKPGVVSSGFKLESNLTVDLNRLTSVQIAEYVKRIKVITQTLNIDDNEFIGDGILRIIEDEILSMGINISEEALAILKDFVIYGESKSGKKISSKDFTKLMNKEDISKLRSIGLTSASKIAKKVAKIISPFKNIFVDLGIDLLKGIKSAYMSEEQSQKNIKELKEKLQSAIDDLSFYMDSTPQKDWDTEVLRLQPHYNKVLEKGIDNIVATSVEGGVYDYQGDLLKVTGGFAPLNQILGAAYRDKKGIFPTFKEKFMQQESNRRSLKDVFNLIY